MAKLAWAVVFAVAVAGCTKRVSVPAPARGNNPPAAPPPVAATNIGIDVSADMAPMLALLSAAAPKPLTRGNQQLNLVDRFIAKVKADVRYEAHLHKVALNIAGRHVTASVDLDLKLKVSAKLSGLAGRFKLSRGLMSCGYDGPMPRVRLTITGTLRTLAGPTLRLDGAKWRTTWLRRCKLAFNIGLDRLLGLPLVRGRVSAAIDDALAKAPKKIGLASRIRPLVEALSRPHIVGPGVRLHIEPAGTNVAPIRGRGTRLSTRIRVAAKITARATIPYTQLATDLGTAYGRVNSVSTRAVQVFASNGQVVVGLNLDAPVRGIVYLRGKPGFAPETNAIRIPDLRFTKASAAALDAQLGAAERNRLQSELRAATVLAQPELATALRKLRRHTLDVGIDAKASVALTAVTPGYAAPTDRGLELTIGLTALAGQR